MPKEREKVLTRHNSTIRVTPLKLKPTPFSSSPRKPVTPRKAVKKVNPKRQAKEAKRTYGPKPYQTWLKAQPCLVCVILNPACAEQDGWHCDQAHTEGGGAGRKGHFTSNAPMCRLHHIGYDLRMPPFNDAFLRLLIFDAAPTYYPRWLALTTPAAHLLRTNEP